MRVEFLEIDLQWPSTVYVKDLRHWILNQINRYGKPLRWAITNVSPCACDESTKSIRVEVVLIKN